MSLIQKEQKRTKQEGKDALLRAMMESPGEILRRGLVLPVKKQELTLADRKKGKQAQVVLKPPAPVSLRPLVRDDGAVRQRYAEELRRKDEIRKKAPATMSGRLAGGGMNLTGEEQAAVRLKEADRQRRLKAGAASLGYTAVGILPNLLETLDQSNKNYEANRTNLPYQRAKAKAEQVNSYAMSRLVAETGNITEKHREYLDKMAKADALAIKTPVDQSLFGQRMMAKSREAHEIATEGMGILGKLVADTAISVVQNLPAVGASVLTKNPMTGLSLMSLQAASQKTAELNARGIDPATALGRGIVSGTIEGVTEKLPLDNLMKIVQGKTGKAFLVNLFKQAGMEGVEEGVAYAGNFIADAAANDPEAQFSLMDLGLAMASGFLSGGVLSSAGTAVGGALNSRASQQGRLPNMDTPPTAQISSVFEPSKTREASKAETKEHTNELLVKLRRSIPDMALDNPVKALSGMEFPKNDVGIVKQVGDFFRSIGNKVTRQGFGDVIIDEAGVQSDIAHGLGRAKSVTFAAVPDVIQNGKQIDFQQNWKGRGYDSYVFAAPVTIAGKRAYVTAVVSRAKNSQKFYLHEVLDGDGNIIYIKKEDTSPIKTGPSEQVATGGEASSQEVGHIKTGITVRDGITSGPNALTNPTVPQKAQGVNSQSMQDGQSYAQQTQPYLPTPQQAQNVRRMQETAPQQKQTAEARENAKELLGKLKHSIPDMALANPVKALSGREFPKSDVGIVKQVGDFFRSLGNKVTRQNFGDVIIDEAGVQSDIAHGLGQAKSVTFAAVPEVIKNGKQIDFQQNWKGRGYDSYVFAAPVTIAGKRAYVAAVVTQESKNRFYLHEVLDGDGNIIYLKDKEPSAIKTGVTVQDGVTSDAGSLFDPTIPQMAQGVNIQSMQGYPKYSVGYFCYNVSFNFG